VVKGNPQSPDCASNAMAPMFLKELVREIGLASRSLEEHVRVAVDESRQEDAIGEVDDRGVAR
jgi:hypothetical protein